MSDRAISLTLKESDVKKIEKVMDETVVSFLNNLPVLISKKLETIVFQALGFRQDSWGHIEATREKSVIIDMINVKSMQVCHDAVNKFDLTLSKSYEEALSKAYADKLMSYMNHEIDTLVKRHIESFFNKAINEGEIKLNVIVKQPSLKELTDPEHMQSTPGLRELVYSEIMKKDQNA
jgi:hypothetical protein